MSTKQVEYKALNRHFSVHPAYLVFVCSAVILCLVLANWQWQRAQTAQQRYAFFLKQSSLPPVQLSSQLTEFQTARLSGDIKRLFFLDNQIHQGIVGWQVIAQVDTNDYPVLVNLGWQSKQDKPITTAELPDVLAVSGLLKKPEPGFMLAKSEADPNWPYILQQIQLPLLNAHFHYQLFPYVVYANDAIADLTPAPVQIENKFAMHLGYAIQWGLIAIVCVVGFIVFSRRTAPYD